jgi:hypothetical protein
LLRSRYFTNSSTPPSYIIFSCFSTGWRSVGEQDVDAGIQEGEFAQAMLERGEIKFERREGFLAEA